MKPSTKAVIYSAFIFPGAGLWSLGQRGRAAVFAIPAIVAVGYMLVGSWRIAQRIADQMAQEILATGQLSLDLGYILTQVREAVAQHPGLRDAQWIFIAAWLLSIASSYAVGKLQDEKTFTPESTQPKE